ncbi:MAG TPA: hypothetical protein VN698_05780 [Bacteroidia bacterium]|nr:hypothetical protein [Bacteroidia bacterium]
MKKAICLVWFLGFINTFCFAQKEKTFYKEAQIETADYDLIIVGAVSTPLETKFKIKIINKTASYLSYNPTESKFIINNVEYPVVNEKPIMIEPYKTDSKVINLKGSGYNMVRNYSFIVGGIYKLSANLTIFTGDDYKLPPSANVVNVGPYTVTLEKLEKESGKTTAKFVCVYNGDKTGIIYPTYIAVKMPDGKEYATVKKEKTILLFKGQFEDFTVAWEKMPGGRANDMQLVDMFVKWNKAFNEAEKEKTPESTFNLSIDELKTNK